MISVITGNGGGKTTGALGIAIRALGRKKKVVIVQFMKGRTSGEYLFLKGKCTIKKFGSTKFVDLKNPSKADRMHALDAFAFAKESLKSKPFLIILDEINLACASKLLPITDVLDFLKKCGKTNVILTGRYAPQEFVLVADRVTEVSDLKRNDADAVAGLEY